MTRRVYIAQLITAFDDRGVPPCPGCRPFVEAEHLQAHVRERTFSKEILDEALALCPAPKVCAWYVKECVGESSEQRARHFDWIARAMLTKTISEYLTLKGTP